MRRAALIMVLMAWFAMLTACMANPFTVLADGEESRREENQRISDKNIRWPWSETEMSDNVHGGNGVRMEVNDDVQTVKIEVIQTVVKLVAEGAYLEAAEVLHDAVAEFGWDDDLMELISSCNNVYASR